jgi:hypothetical protein
MRPTLRFSLGCAGLLILSGGSALGCASCFGASDSAMAQGMNMGIFALLGVIGFVLAGVVTVAVSLAVRASRVARAHELRAAAETPQMDVQDASRLMRSMAETK